MSSQLQFKCPCCGGAMAFASELQKVKCPYCDTEFEMETLKSYDNDINSNQADETVYETPEQTMEGEEFRSFICNSCGGELVTDEQTAATLCPFCNNPVVMQERLAGFLKPDYVVPFRLDKKAAKDALRRHVSGKKLLPKLFKDENHIDEIRGLYVPFWLFDAETDAGIHYRAAKVRSWSDRSYNYTEKRFFSVYRRGNLAFEGVPVDGSRKMPDDLMESLEPFDYHEAVPFQSAYLAGFLADKYDVSSEESTDRANQRMKATAETVIRDTIKGYDIVTPEASSIKVDNGKAKYALMPIWLLNTTWQGKTYTFAMNGQTGKFVGNLPCDKKQAAKWFWGLTGIVSAAVFGLSYLLWLL